MSLKDIYSNNILKNESEALEECI